MARAVKEAGRQGGHAHPTTRPPQEGGGGEAGRTRPPKHHATEPQTATQPKRNETAGLCEGYIGTKAEGKNKMARLKSKLQVIDRHARALGYGKELDTAQDEAFKNFQTKNKAVLEMVKNAIIQEETAKIQNANAKIEVVKGI